MKLIYIAIITLFVGYVGLGIHQYDRVLQESIAVVKEDIALDLATAQLLAAQKKIETLKKFGFHDLRMMTDEPEFRLNSLLDTRLPLFVDGNLVGFIVDSPKLSTLIHFIIGSTYLGVFFGVLFIFIIAIIVVPLASYKRRVQNFIQIAKVSRLGSIPDDNLDAVTSEIRQIIELNIYSATKIQQLGFEIKQNEAVANLAKQVAHDVRSPLSILNMLIPSYAQEPTLEKRELLILATQRIDKIADDLLKKSKNTDSDCELSTVDIEKIVLEKQMLLASQSKKVAIVFKPKTKSIFKTKLPKIDFERIISNLINNAIEALSDKNDGVISLGISEIDNSTVVTISDNGRGIEKSLLSKIGKKGFTFGKVDGNGLGVYHAKSTIENAGGRLLIDSQLGIGTTITISI